MSRTTLAMVSASTAASAWPAAVAVSTLSALGAPRSSTLMASISAAGSDGWLLTNTSFCGAVLALKTKKPSQLALVTSTRAEACAAGGGRTSTLTPAQAVTLSRSFTTAATLPSAAPPSALTMASLRTVASADVVVLPWNTSAGLGGAPASAQARSSAAALAVSSVLPSSLKLRWATDLSPNSATAAASPARRTRVAKAFSVVSSGTVISSWQTTCTSWVMMKTAPSQPARPNAGSTGSTWFSSARSSVPWLSVSSSPDSRACASASPSACAAPCEPMAPKRMRLPGPAACQSCSSSAVGVLMLLRPPSKATAPTGAKPSLRMAAALAAMTAARAVRYCSSPATFKCCSS